MQVPGTEEERSRCRAQYARHADRRRAARRERYYANIDAERASANTRMKTAPVYKRRRLARLDDRWLRWARELGVKL